MSLNDALREANKSNWSEVFHILTPIKDSSESPLVLCWLLLRSVRKCFPLVFGPDCAPELDVILLKQARSAPLEMQQEAESLVHTFERALTASSSSSSYGVSSPSVCLLIGLWYDHIHSRFDKASDWYHQAAIGGSSIGQLNYGICFYYGDGVPKSYSQAIVWYRLAAEQNNSAAISNLGLCYDEGQGVEPDKVEALRLYRMAVELGNPIAMLNCGLCLFSGEGLPQEDKPEAIRLWKRAAANGNASAKLQLAIAYYSGTGVVQNSEKGYKWLSQAAESGVVEARYQVAHSLMTGDGVKKNPTQAIEMLTQLAQNGHAESQSDLGGIYESGDGVPQNLKESLKWYEAASQSQGENSSIRMDLIYCRFATRYARSQDQSTRWLISAAQVAVDSSPLIFSLLSGDSREAHILIIYGVPLLNDVLQLAAADSFGSMVIRFHQMEQLGHTETDTVFVV